MHHAAPKIVPLLLTLVLMASCGSGPEPDTASTGDETPGAQTSGDPDPPPETSPIEAAALSDTHLDRIAAALPSSEELPDGFAVTRLCPSTTACGPWPGEGADLISIVGGPEGEWEEDWLPPSISMTIARYEEPDQAEQRTQEIAATYEPYDGDFDIAPDQEEGSWTPGEEGTGEVSAFVLDGDWSQITGHFMETQMRYLAPDGEETQLRETARTVSVHESTVLQCQADLLAGDSALEVCQDLITDYMQRLAELPAHVETPFITPTHLTEALPGRDDFDEETHYVSQICPGDDSCERSDLEDVARMTVYLPLPEGVEHATGRSITSESGRSLTEFVAEGTDLRQRMSIRAHLDWTAEEAATTVSQHEASYDVGQVDSSPEAMETTEEDPDGSYHYGLSGQQSVEPFTHDEWSGFSRVFQGTWEDIHSNVDPEQIDVTIEVHRDRARIEADASLTPEGRSAEEAAAQIQGMLTDYLDALDSELNVEEP
ncbi:hypothetical protein [Nesterenkonia muleiensis]|uniref:hypothetical protein n=1 Tax=Nesterenkonia muleiensis TaxID=2282648 RepID=UPI000E71CB04|nr:hypothetical protein [Nesterenkonia muleiensis]